jgi:hypothetical protein
MVLAATAGVAPAQHKWKAGIKGGFNSSQFRGDPASPWVMKPAQGLYLDGNVGDKLSGVVVGGFFRRDIGDWFGLQLELLYSQQGGQGTVNGFMRLQAENNLWYTADIDGTLRVRMDYLEFPLLALFEFPSEDRVGFTVLLGPSFGYNSRAEAKIEGQASIPLQDGSNRVTHIDERIPIQGDINRWQISGVVGAALEFYMKSSIIVLDGRYQFGVTSISNDQSTYNHVFSLTIAFMAPLKS